MNYVDPDGLDYIDDPDVYQKADNFLNQIYEKNIDGSIITDEYGNPAVRSEYKEVYYQYWDYAESNDRYDLGQLIDEWLGTNSNKGPGPVSESFARSIAKESGPSFDEIVKFLESIQSGSKLPAAGSVSMGKSSNVECLSGNCGATNRGLPNYNSEMIWSGVKDVGWGIAQGTFGTFLLGTALAQEAAPTGVTQATGVATGAAGAYYLVNGVGSIGMGAGKISLGLQAPNRNVNDIPSGLPGLDVLFLPGYPQATEDFFRNQIKTQK
ncbi:MAG: hypothetical protein GF398_17960 [Chitinivibrionales bacterium]|nr:hypothetical protein [Chitinivibrionales bacterium]